LPEFPKAAQERFELAPHRLRRFEKFLREALAQGPRSAVDMEDEADANGIAPATLKRARKELNIRAFKLGRAWYWELPRPKAKEEDHQEDQRA